MAEQLYMAGRVYNVINTRNFIELLGKEVKDLTKDLIEYVTELYGGPDYDIEIEITIKINNLKLSLIRAYRAYRAYKSFIY